MSTETMLDRVWAIYNQVRSEYRHRPPTYVEDDTILARPSEMPAHVWRVSPSNWRAIYAMKVPGSDGLYFMGGLGVEDRLFGFPIEIEHTADDLLELVPAQ